MKFICNVATEILPCCGLSARLKDVYVHVYDINTVAIKSWHSIQK